MTYCANCGAPVEGRFCAKCGTPAVAPASAGVSPASVQGLGMEENLAAALCYVPIIGLIFLLLDPYKQNRTIRFHAWQGVLVGICWIVILFILGRFFALLPFGMWLVWSLIMRLVQLGFIVVLIMAGIKAYQRSRLLLPFVGPLAEKQASASR